MDDSSSLIFLIVSGISVVIFQLFLNAWPEEAIRKYIKNEGNNFFEIHEIVVTRFNKLYFERVFLVRYVTSACELYEVRCVTSFLELSWGTPVFQRMMPSIYCGERSRPSSSTDNNHLYSPKERILNNLTSVYKHERIAAIKQVGAMPDVDPHLLDILKDMRASDPDWDVRDVAKEAISNLG